MKKVGIQMSILMGVTLSFFLSLVGNLTSGHFAILGFLISFLISTIISLIIGFFVPMKRLNDFLDNKLGLQPGKLGTHCFESLVSDIIYTPLITFCMVTMAYKQANAQGAPLHYWPMLGKSLIITMLVGYILIFIFMPLYMKLVLKLNGINRQ